MNEDKYVTNFYEKEAQYEKSILIVKQLVEKVVKLDKTEFNKKISIVDKDGYYSDFIDLFVAVTGRKTNKYYYCMNQEDVKYHGLEYGKIYKMNEISLDLQSKYTKETILNLEARGILAEELLNKTKNLKQLFSDSIKKGDGLISTIESVMILESDVEYLDKLLEYLVEMTDKDGRLKILVAERDVYAYEKANEQYEQKTGIEKLFHKIFNTKKSTIEDMTNKNKYTNPNKKQK